MGRERSLCLSALNKQTLGDGWVVLDTELALLHDLVNIDYHLYTGKRVRKPAKNRVGGY